MDSKVTWKQQQMQYLQASFSIMGAWFTEMAAAAAELRQERGSLGRVARMPAVQAGPEFQ
jgi:hypothetical protein